MSGMEDVGASAGLPPVDVSTLSTHAVAGKFQTAEDTGLHSPRGKLPHTPLSQPSTAPSTPKLSFDLDPEGHHSIFYRCISGVSTIDPVIEHEHDEDDWDESSLPPLSVSRLDHEALQDELLGAVKVLYRGRYGKDVDDESDEELEYDADGTPWIKQVGTGPLTVPVLEDKLAQVKDLYTAKFGRDLDEEWCEEYEYDQDGTPWIKSQGAGPITVESLEGKLAEVKELFKDAYGEDADAESATQEYECDVDGMVWIKTTGKGPLTVDLLEERLDEVKELYEAKFGADVDDSGDDQSEFEYDQDGTAWTKTVGTGPLTVGVLEDQLAEVKGLFRQRFGQDADEESEADECEYDVDGTLWIKTVGTGPLTVDVLEDQLAEVKGLFREKFGQDADEESEADEYEYDADGTPWIKSVGAGPLTVSVLEDRLADVKDLFRQKFGQDADAESEADAYEYDADGTPWVKSVGAGPLTVGVLEDRLADVKDLFRQKFGQDADEESEADECEYDADGTLWIKTVGTGPLTVDVLEDQLAEVKELFRQKFGQDADEESEADECEYDADGTPWIKTVGTGPLTVDVLEDQLAAVKELFRQKFGQDADEESEADECEYDVDGTLWIKTVGSGPLTVDVLEDRLAEVKELFRQKFGQDADEESEADECEYDADGTLWIKTVGTGPLTVDVLEDQLAEVKELFKQKFGQDADEESEADECEYDVDGTLWIKTVGTGPLTVDVLEDNLAEVKELFRQKFGQDADEESEADECAYDADGTLWIKTVGTGPLTVDLLEDRLAEVKELFRQKFGQDADEESDADEHEYDADGTPWIKSVGSGPLTVGVLEDRLAEVKDLFRAKFGGEVDESSDDEYEYDQEGTPWIKTVGAGPLTVGVLEARLAEVKDLYRDAFGRDADSESEEGSECEYDADGVQWIKTVGEGPLTISVLEDKLAAVKALFGEKYGHDVDEESDAEQIEYDKDGTEWIKTVGKGPLTYSVLEDRLEEVKELFEGRFGRFVEEESEDEEPDLQYDQDGTLWFKWQGTGASTCTA